MTNIEYSAIRSDWLNANQYIPRLLKKAILGEELVFSGFPAHWIPLFELFQIKWRACINAPESIPLFSMLNNDLITEMSNHAKENGVLRNLVEATVSCDPLLSDLLYIVDNSVNSNSEYFLSTIGSTEDRHHKEKYLKITSWQSYGRPEIIDFEREAYGFKKSSNEAVIFPCSQKRPYSKSRTYTKIRKIVIESGVNLDQCDQFVLTAIGLIPESLWSHPVVLSYDTGVPDVYRNLRILRKIFHKNNYTRVYDCIQFQPYRDLLNIVRKEGLIGELVRIEIPKRRTYYVRH